MAISIKSIGGTINEVPKINDLKVTVFDTDAIEIEYKVEDIELTICRHYLLLNSKRTEITKEVGYEQENNMFRYKIKGLNRGTTYTIQIVASDGIDEGLSKAIQQTTKNIQIHGVRVMENNSNPFNCCTYIEEAVGVNPANSTSLGGWANKFPFNKIRIVGFKGGKVVKEIKKDNKAQYIDGTNVPSDVDVMVEIPKVYWKFTNIENGYELRISDTKLDGYDCYAHKVSGVEKDFIYVGAYLGYVESNKLKSRSRVAPTSSVTPTNLRIYAQSNGSGYQLWNWYTLILLQILYLIAYKNLNSQTALGMGCCKLNKKINTGGTDIKGFVYGEKNGYEQMCFLGIEDFYGNLGQFVDGMKVDNSHNVMVVSDNKNFNDDTSGYEKVGKTKTLGSLTNKVMHTNKGGFFPMESNGSETTHYCDYGNVNPDRFGYSGGVYSDGYKAGAFYISIGILESSGFAHFCSRLCYLGE